MARRTVLSTTISPEALEKLTALKERMGFTGYGKTIEWLVSQASRTVEMAIIEKLSEAAGLAQRISPAHGLRMDQLTLLAQAILEMKTEDELRRAGLVLAQALQQLRNSK